MKAMLEACLEKMEENPEKIKSVAKHQEDPNEEAAVEMIKATENQARDRAIPAWYKGHSHKGPTTEKR
jgi:hypothetical protein